MKKKIIRFEYIVRRGKVCPIVRILVDGNIYSFELEGEYESQLIRLLSGGPQKTVDIPIDVIKQSEDGL